MKNKRYLLHSIKKQHKLLIGVILACLLLMTCTIDHDKKTHVGILIGLDFASATADGFKAGMAKLGYVEGHNIHYDTRVSDFDRDAYKHAIRKFVTDKVDLIFVFPTEATIVAKKVTQGSGIPVVFAIANIEGIDLVNSVRQPGGNITGVRYPGPDIAVKRFEIMREMAPHAKRIWLPYQRGYSIVAAQLEALYPLAAKEGITLIEAPADNAAELETYLQAHAHSDVIDIDFIMLLVEPLVVTPDATAVVGKFATAHKIPIGGMLLTGGQGSVFELNVDMANDGRDAAQLADKILKGTPAGAIPVISSESFLRVDYTAAKKLGLNVSEGLLGQANEIIR